MEPVCRNRLVSDLVPKSISGRTFIRGDPDWYFFEFPVTFIAVHFHDRSLPGTIPTDLWPFIFMASSFENVRAFLNFQLFRKKEVDGNLDIYFVNFVQLNKI